MKQTFAKKTLSPIFIYGLLFSLMVKTVHGQCVPDPNNPFGCIDNPLPTSAPGPGGGLIVLLSNILRLVFVGAGIFAFLRVVTAGIGFIGAGGDSKKIAAAWDSIWQSLLGLVIIVSSFAIAAIAGQLLFGSWFAILNPQVYGP